MNPENFTNGQVLRRLFGVSWNVRKVEYFLKIGVSGLNIVKNSPNNFLVPSQSSLNISDRIVGGGISIFKIKF